jgi:hypothetical protein
VNLVRTGLDAQDSFAHHTSGIWDGASAATEGNSKVSFVALTQDDGAGITIGFNVTSVSAGDTIVQEFMMVEVLN